MIQPILTVVLVVVLCWAVWILHSIASRLHDKYQEMCDLYRTSCGVILPPPPRVPREFVGKESET